MAELYDLRREYGINVLTEDQLDPNPFSQFREWFNQTLDSGLPDPNAMILSTSGSNNRPSSRIVLLKEITTTGFTFFSHYESRKGHEIQQNPYGALLFPWHILERQVRIEGKIVKSDPVKSDEYFQSRPEGSQIAAWTSQQSQEIPSRGYLETREEQFRAEFKVQTIPRPPQWGGYCLIPDLFEFWQGRESRLHDRFEYYLKESLWKIRRLAP